MIHVPATAWLHGTADAPLRAGRRYTFARAPGVLAIPVIQRGTWDDFGVVEFPEQDAFVARRCAGRPGVGGQLPGEWTFADPAVLDAVWAELVAQVTPEGPVPDGVASAEVDAASARGASERLVPAALALAERVLGAAGRFHLAAERIEHPHLDEGAPVRISTWSHGELRVEGRAEALGSGVGIHGEATTLHARDGTASVTVSARIDLRTGGTIEVRVAGVRDGPALAGEGCARIRGGG